MKLGFNGVLQARFFPFSLCRYLSCLLVLLALPVMAEDPDLLAFVPAPQPEPARPISEVVAGSTAYISIIIDDIGYNRRQAEKLLSIPGDLTFALIPETPHAQWFAERAHTLNKEIMLHVPMSHVNHRGHGAELFHSAMGEQEFDQRLQAALDSIPNIRGINNHMGSQLTQESEPMSWVMRALNQRGLFFIDSRTTDKSVAWDVARQHQVPTLKRDVFLDHEQDEAFIREQFQRLLALAKDQGYAVAIGHPYPETIHFLKAQIPELNAMGIHLVSASKLVESYHTPLEFP